MEVRGYGCGRGGMERSVAVAEVGPHLGAGDDDVRVAVAVHVSRRERQRRVDTRWKRKRSGRTKSAIAAIEHDDDSVVPRYDIRFSVSVEIGNRDPDKV